MNGCGIVLLSPPTRCGHHCWCPLRKRTIPYVGPVIIVFWIPYRWRFIPYTQHFGSFGNIEWVQSIFYIRCPKSVSFYFDWEKIETIDSLHNILGVKGRKCQVYEANYHSSKGELLALMYGLQKFNHLLHWKKFVVITDSNTVLHLSTMKDPGGTIWRWLDFIQELSFTVNHWAGKHNVFADLKSRAKHMIEPAPSIGTIT